jgi:membrane fusion protein
MALFRDEVVETRKSAWLGPVQLAQPLSVRLVSGVTAALFFAVLIFAVLGTYTRRVHATGILMPKAGLITLASPAAGIVTSASVKEGDAVAKGALLYVLDLDTRSADGATEQHVIAQLIQQKTNLEKQRANRLSIAKIEKQALQDQRVNLESQNQQLQQQILIQNNAVAAMKAKADQLRSGVRSGIVSDPDYQSQNYIYIQALSEAAQFQQNDLQIQGRLSDLDHQLLMFDDKLAQDIFQINRDLLRLDQLIAENQAKQSIEVRAPESGMATSIRVHVGQQVAAGAQLVTVLPRTDNLEVNLFVNSAAIGFVEKGAPVILRYAAYPFQRYGLYRGRVAESTHAPVGVGDFANGVQSNTADSIYRILVTPEANYVLANGERKPLEAGMRVDADIALEKRPLYRWLFDPLYHIQRSVALVSDGGVR